MTPLPTIALVEFRWVGHHPTFYRFFCESLLATGCRVLALAPCPEVIARWHGVVVDQARAEGRLLSRRFTDTVADRRWARKVPAWATIERFRQCGQELAAWEREMGIRVDRVFFACLYTGAALSSGAVEHALPYPWAGLLLDSACVRRSRGWQLFCQRTTDALAAFRARNCQGLGTLDTFIRDGLQARLGRDKLVAWIPEPTDISPPPAQEHLEGLPAEARQRAAGRPVIGCFGQFARRKGALEFLRAAEHCEQSGEDWLFVWAGAFEVASFSTGEQRWIQAYLAREPANCLVRFGRVEDGPEFNALVAVCDVLFLCYRDHIGSSNVISKAVYFDKPVLVTDSDCLADVTRHYNLGVCLQNPGNVAACRAALRQILVGRQPKARFEEFRRDHSHARFSAAVQELAGVASD